MLSEKWLKAAVIGSLWAAIEIILGSFLHNLRIPFAGTFLSMTSAFLLISFMIHWNDKGIILRAGIICALMKSVSPSAIILGPMIAIFMEAFFLETARTIFGRNLLAYSIGAALAVSWTLVQKILNYIVLYGFDLIKVAESFYYFLLDKSKLHDIEPKYLVYTIITIYVIAGIVAAFLAYFTSKNIILTTTNDINYKKSDKKVGMLFGENKNRKHAFLNLIFIILGSGLSLYFLSKDLNYTSVLIGLVFIIYVLLRYKSSLRHLKKKSVWIQFILITLFATMLWEWLSTGEYFTVNGLKIGLEMNFRAMILIFSFSAISVELRSPIVKNVLYNAGFSKLYKALSISFSAFPTIVEKMPGFKSIIKKRKSILHELFMQAETLLIYFNENMKERKNIFIVTGEVNEGKSTFVRQFSDFLLKKGKNACGFVTRGTFKEGQRENFSLFDLKEQKEHAFISSEEIDNWVKFRKFYFNPEIFDKGMEIMESCITDKNDLIILDEIGPMEAEKNGWFKVMEKLAENSEIKQIWVCRKDLAEGFANEMNIPQTNISSISNTDFKSLEKIIFE